MIKSGLLVSLFLLCLFIFGLSSCVSRLSRPEISGVIVDYDKEPVAGCKVGETFTAQDGSFRLPEQRYNKFFLTEVMTMEAPPLMVSEDIEKTGYEKENIYLFSRWGGGVSKGSKHNMDTIFLKKIDQQLDLASLISNSRWDAAANRNVDTIYLVKEGFEKSCKTARCDAFFGDFQRLTDHYYDTAHKNVPERVLRKSVKVTFKSPDLPFAMQVIQEYDHQSGGADQKPDTLNTTGYWKIRDRSSLIFEQHAVKLLSGTYHISEFGLYQLLLTKSGK